MKASKKPSKEGRRAEKALQMAVAGVIEEHRRLGLPIAVMKNGKAVYVSVDGKAPSARESKKHYKAH
jgi:Lhr-like helicase